MGLIAGGLLGGVIASGSDLFFESPNSQNFRVSGIVVCNESAALSTFSVTYTEGSSAYVAGDYLYHHLELDPNDTWREWARDKNGLFTLRPYDRIYVICDSNEVTAKVFGELVLI